jgi:hypothetical protein
MQEITSDMKLAEFITFYLPSIDLAVERMVGGAVTRWGLEHP